MGECYLYISVFLAQLSTIISSTTLTWSSPMLILLNDTDHNPLGRIITETENSWLASIPNLGACFGAILCGMLSLILGRKTLLLALGFPYLICYTVIAFSKTIWLMYLMRFICGAALGGNLTILPIYCAELAEAKNRGKLCSFITVFVNIGLLQCYVMGPYLTFFWFNISLTCNPVIYIILFYIFAPESPYYLIKSNRHNEARAVLEKLRGHNQAIEEMHNIEREIQETKQQSSLLDILRSSGLWKSLSIGCGCYLFQLLTGTSIVASYTESIFAKAGANSKNGPIYVGLAQLLTTLVISLIMDKFPRKTLLMISFPSVAVVLVALGYYFFQEDRHVDVSGIAWLPLTSLIIYVCVYNIGIGPVFMTFLGEICPTNVKGVVSSILVLVMWLSAFILVRVYNNVCDAIGTGEVFWCFAGISLVAILFVKFVVIETQGKDLKQIQDELNA